VVAAKEPSWVLWGCCWGWCCWFELALVARMVLDWVGYWLPGAGGGRSRGAGWRTP
jgi:hypothetical protein